jgi:hypothetical protein
MMIDLMLEDSIRDDEFDGVRLLISEIMQEGLADARAALHELADIISELEQNGEYSDARAALHELDGLLESEIGDGMPVASNTFPPTEVWS